MEAKAKGLGEEPPLFFALSPALGFGFLRRPTSRIVATRLRRRELKATGGGQIQ